MIDIHEFAGRSFHSVEIDGQVHDELIDVPGEGLYPHFRTRDHVVVSPYGNEVIPRSLATRLFGPDHSKAFLAIDVDTGMCRFAWGRSDDTLVLRDVVLVGSDEAPAFVVPSKLRRHLDGLLVAKRPFWFDIDHWFLLSLAAGEVDVPSLKEGVFLVLDIPGMPDMSVLRLYADGFAETHSSCTKSDF